MKIYQDTGSQYAKKVLDEIAISKKKHEKAYIKGS